MTTIPAKLDRLSALLQGLAPQVRLLPVAYGGAAAKPSPAQHFAAQAAPMLTLHLVNTGKVVLRAGPHTLTAQAPSMVVCHGAVAHSLRHQGPGPSDAVLTAQAWLVGPVAPLLLEEFGQPLVVPLGDADPALTHIISLVRGELLDPRCGHPALLNSAGDIVFIALLRHLVAHPGDHHGLFQGLADPRIAKTLVAMHSGPHQPWTLESLAEHAGMSRTAFAVRFKNTLRCPPGKYLTRLRLQIAQRSVQSGQGLKAAARAAGFGNVSALSRALSRTIPRTQPPNAVPPTPASETPFL
ncbi:MAG: AraC family transcriptional regulator [Rhodoferax sp.]|nr:AraC family transcriptional regulator [Rhodoferax sp.]